MIAGIILIVIGIAFLLQNMGLIAVSAWQVIWPIMIIILGLSIMCPKDKCNGWMCCGKSEK